MKSFLFFLTLACFCLAGLPSDAAAQDKDAIYIIFDASGSMWGELPDQSRKVTVAKQVLEDFVAGDFEGYELALRAYGLFEGWMSKGIYRPSSLLRTSPFHPLPVSPPHFSLFSVVPRPRVHTISAGNIGGA